MGLPAHNRTPPPSTPDVGLVLAAGGAVAMAAGTINGWTAVVLIVALALACFGSRASPRRLPGWSSIQRWARSHVEIVTLVGVAVSVVGVVLGRG